MRHKGEQYRANRETVSHFLTLFPSTVYCLIRSHPQPSAVKYFWFFRPVFRLQISRIPLPHNTFHRKHYRKFFLGCNMEIKLKNESPFDFASSLSASRPPFSWPSGNWD
jgi:hypothetical protein